MNFDQQALHILRCPITKERLAPAGGEGGTLKTPDGKHVYRVVDGVHVMINDDMISTDALRSSVKTFYDEWGWSRDKDAVFNDTKAFVDHGTTARAYTSACIADIGKTIDDDGTYLLDAGSGPIPHADYLAFHNGYQRRVCLDFSMAALREAKRKLGDSGNYVLGDLTALPFADDCFDGIACCHVLSHIPAELQPVALCELGRVLKPGGRGAVVYRWEDAPLSRRLEKLFGVIGRVVGPKLEEKVDHGNLHGHNLYFHAHPRAWLIDQQWPFRYRLKCFRVIDNLVMKRFMREGLIWRAMGWILLGWQRLMPGFTGTYGAYPIVVIEK